MNRPLLTWALSAVPVHCHSTRWWQQGECSGRRWSGDKSGTAEYGEAIDRTDPSLATGACFESEDRPERRSAAVGFEERLDKEFLVEDANVAEQE